LFAASRRPAPAAPEAKEAAKPVAAAPPVQPEAPPSAEGFRLVGMIEAPGGGRRILLRANEQATGVWVREGDEVGGWRVSAIGPSAAIIEQRGTQVELRLFPR
jgi:hypothetical protein